MPGLPVGPLPFRIAEPRGGFPSAKGAFYISEGHRPSKGSQLPEKASTLHNTQGPTARAIHDPMIGRAFSPRIQRW